MDKFQFNLFDIFGNIIPGSLILYSLSQLLLQKTIDLSRLISTATDLDFTGLISLVLISYVLGYVAQYFSNKLFKFFLKKRNNDDFNFTNQGNALSKIRQESPNNFILIQRFQMLRIFGYNMSFSCLIYVVCFLISLIFHLKTYQLVDYLTCLVILIISWFLMLRAEDFIKYSHSIIKDTISILD